MTEKIFRDEATARLAAWYVKIDKPVITPRGEQFALEIPIDIDGMPLNSASWESAAIHADDLVSYYCTLKKINLSSVVPSVKVEDATVKFNWASVGWLVVAGLAVFAVLKFLF